MVARIVHVMFLRGGVHILDCLNWEIKGWFPKGWFWRNPPDVPPERKPERGYIRMLPRNENGNEGRFGCSPGTKTGTRVLSPKPPFYETALLSLEEDKRATTNEQNALVFSFLFSFKKRP